MKNKIVVVGSGNIANDIIKKENLEHFGTEYNPFSFNDNISTLLYNSIPTIDSRIHLPVDTHISNFQKDNKLTNNILTHFDTEADISKLILKYEGDHMNHKQKEATVDITKESKSYNATDWSDDTRKCRNKIVHVVNVYEDSNVVLGNYGSKKREQHFIDIGSGMLVPYKQNLDNREQYICTFDEEYGPKFVKKYDINGYEIKRSKE